MNLPGQGKSEGNCGGAPRGGGALGAVDANTENLREQIKGRDLKICCIYK